MPSLVDGGNAAQLCSFKEMEHQGQGDDFLPEEHTETSATDNHIPESQEMNDDNTETNALKDGEGRTLRVTEGCSNIAIKGGVYQRHGTKPKMCSHEARRECHVDGCTADASKGAFCSIHWTPRPRCTHEGCTSQAIREGVCQRHGARPPTCNHEGCTNQVVMIKKGVCRRHGAKPIICNVEECTNQALRGGVCHRHGGKPKRCSHEGCNNASRRGGVCVKHGAKPKRCSAEGCTKKALRGGVCARHGAVKKSCSHEGCSNYAIKEGVCQRHGAKRRICSHEGCTNCSRKRGLCKRHGERDTCSHDGCDNYAIKAGVCWRHGAKLMTGKHGGCAPVVNNDIPNAPVVNIDMPELPPLPHDIQREDMPTDGDHADREVNLGQSAESNDATTEEKKHSSDQDVDSENKVNDVAIDRQGIRDDTSGSTVNNGDDGDVSFQAEEQNCKNHECQADKRGSGKRRHHEITPMDKKERSNEIDGGDDNAPKKYILKCKHEGCTRWARGKGGMCCTHGGRRRGKTKTRKLKCSHEECDNQAKTKGGLCGRHEWKLLCLPANNTATSVLSK